MSKAYAGDVRSIVVTDRNMPAQGSPSEVRGLLLALSRRHASERRPRDVLDQWGRDRTVLPSPVDLRVSTRLDLLALDAAREYEAVLLSPVAPLATNSAVAPTSQDRTLSTTRTTEVVSDPTNVLALQAAQMLRVDPSRDVRLCTAHQTLRMQAADAAPGRTQHFRLFAMADAGRGRPDEAFEVDAVMRQLHVIDRFFTACESMGYDLPRRGVIVRVAEERAGLGDRLERSVRESFPQYRFERRGLKSTYYKGVRVGFGPEDGSGELVEVADIGAFDWVGAFTGDAKMRFVASGIGVQLIPLLFDPARTRRS